MALGSWKLCSTALLLWSLMVPRWSHASEPVRIAVRAARLFDGRSAKPLTNAVVLVEGNRIQAVGSGLSIPEGTRVLDLGDVTLMPGLIDAHSHLLMHLETGEGGESMSMELYVARRSTAERALLGAKLGREVLESGITTVRDLGNSGVNGDVALRDAIQRGWVVGPRISACTRASRPRAASSGGSRLRCRGSSSRSTSR